MSQEMPDGNEMRFSYHESNHLERLEARLQGSVGWTTSIDQTEYNAKGQRTRAHLGEGVLTTYFYDKETFRISRMVSARPVGKVTLQDLRFTYDPVGNIVEQQDHAQEDVYFDNAVVSAKGLYEYDALYRLVKAEGREHPGQQPGADDLPWANLPHSNSQAMVRYTETYAYDPVGNIEEMKHLAGAGGWTRRYQYETTSGGAPKSNRLLATSLPGDPAGGPYSASYTYDASGNMTSMPHLSAMRWDWASRLQHVSKGGGGDVHFAYAPDGQRVRKVYQHGNIVGERIYLGAYEVYRRRTSGTVQTERHTLHLMDGDKRLAMAETLTVDQGQPVSAPTARLRYQLPNHLDSVCVEVDETGALISYEEFHPYGTTSFRAAASSVDVSPKRYRYTGMERDEETSLAYHTARYYAPWLGRWTSPDPLGMIDGPNPYRPFLCNPSTNTDRSGQESVNRIESTDDPTDALNYPSIESYREGLAMSLHSEPQLIRHWKNAHSTQFAYSIKFEPADTKTASLIAIAAASPELQQSFEELDIQPDPVHIVNIDNHPSSAETFESVALLGGESAARLRDGSYLVEFSPDLLDISSQFSHIERTPLQAVVHGAAGHALGDIKGMVLGSAANDRFTIEQENKSRAPDALLTDHDVKFTPEEIQEYKELYHQLYREQQR